MPRKLTALEMLLELDSAFFRYPQWIKIDTAVRKLRTMVRPIKAHVSDSIRLLDSCNSIAARAPKAAMYTPPWSWSFPSTDLGTYLSTNGMSELSQ